MTNNKVNADEQVLRMKALMNYGINESKQPAYSSVEYSKVAADGKLYGIVREGSNFFIKVAKDTKGALVAENFDYIGGFRNRKDNMFESFAGAQRYFCEKMMCINESVDDKQKRVIAEAWDLDEKKEVIEEGTRKMRAEIARQRQIMKNAQNINEGKKQCCDMEDCPKCDTVKAEEPKDQPGAPFTEKLTNDDLKKNEKTNIKGKQKPVKESTEVPLVSRKDPNYMDTSHGTEIGNNAPFDNNIEDKPEDAVADAPGGEAEKTPESKNVNEEVVMHDSQNQNSPKPGVGEKGDNEPYDEEVEITEDIDDFGDDLDDDDDVSLDDEISDDEAEADDDLENSDVMDDEAEIADDAVEAIEDEEPSDETVEDDTENVDVEVEGNDDLASRMDTIEAKMDAILDAINNMKYDDNELYDDDDANDDSEEEVEDDEEFEVVESRAYANWKKKMLKEDDDFGKHPAYQKKVMTLPATNMAPDEGDYDMNDESAENDKPYGIKKGDNAPFEQSIERIENAITESVLKFLKKKTK